MLNKKRSCEEWLIAVVILGILVVFFALSQLISYDEQEAMINYEIQKENCEFLREIAREAIIEGDHIDTRKIPSENIVYDITNDNKDKNIIFCYYIEDDSNNFDNNICKVTITLSSDYEILDEKYPEIGSFDEYSKIYAGNIIVLNVFRFTTIMLLVVLVIMLCILIITLCIHIILKALKKIEEREK